jgi:mannan endo-1,4-beta-mannosidase
MSHYFFFDCCLLISKTAEKKPAAFVKAENHSFNGNLIHTWYQFLVFNLGSTGEGGNRERLLRELDRLAAMGVKNLRVMAGSEGPDTEGYRMLPSMQQAAGKYNEKVLEGLDFMLAEMAKRDMVAIMCLNNFWNWSGGVGQYIVWAGDADSIPNPSAPGGDWQHQISQFYSNEARVIDDISVYENMKNTIGTA